MASQTVTVGAIIGRTIENLITNIPAIALYLFVFVSGTSLSEYFARSEVVTNQLIGGIMQITFGLGSIVGGYLLMETMLKRAGLFHSDGPRRYFRYFGQSILIGVGVALGFALFIIPGVILAIRWAIAAPLLVGAGAGAVEGIEQSWRMTKGYSGRIFLAWLPLALLFLLAIGLSAAITLGSIKFAGETDGLTPLFLGNFATNFVAVCVIAMSVALFGLLDSRAAQISEVFA